MKIVRNRKPTSKFNDLKWGDTFISATESYSDPVIWMKCDSKQGEAVSLSSGHVNSSFAAESEVIKIDAFLTVEY